MVYLAFSRNTNDGHYYITMETLSPPPSPREEYAKMNKQISPYYDPYPKVIDVGLIASNLELEYINDRFCIKYDDKYFRLNNSDGTIMLSKTKPLYFIEINKHFITTITPFYISNADFKALNIFLQFLIILFL